MLQKTLKKTNLKLSISLKLFPDLPIHQNDIQTKKAIPVEENDLFSTLWKVSLQVKGNCKLCKVPETLNHKFYHQTYIK